MTVKEVKAKELPALDDDLAIEAGFDTLDELRADIRERLAEAQASEIEAEFREAALDSAVKAATVTVPDSLVEARAQELWDQMIHSLSHQGISKEAYLRISGRDEEEIVAAGRDDARQSLEREAVLAAIVEAEGIEPTEERGRRGADARRGSHAIARRSTRLRVRAAAWTTSRRTSRSARRSTSSPSRRRRSRSSRPRRATSSGRPAKSARRARRSSGLRAPEPWGPLGPAHC